MRSHLAHIFETNATGLWWWIAATTLALAVLVIEHHLVAGFDYRTCVRRFQRVFGVALVLALSAVLLPTSGAQPTTALPDLISDPPNPSFFTELTDADGSTRLVVTFDGYVHNIGDGALDVVGNPQEPDGMKQRIGSGDDWQDVGSPTVRYETDDGHDHFHLIEVIEYVLWNEQRGQQAATGSKIGFCLVDSEQMEPGTDQAYSEDKDNFCEEGNPGATSLRMGISPGWRDIYDATTTLQWVDVTNVAPGRYWIGALTDPNNEIVESNEDNNGLVFSDTTISVPGFEPLASPPIEVGETSAEFILDSIAHGEVSEPIYTIVSGPSSGVLDVPTGADLVSPVVHYFPEPGFSGNDEITFSVHDAGSQYPFERPLQTVTFTVSPDASADSTTTGNGAMSLVVASTLFEVEVGEPFEAQVEMLNAGEGPTRLFASGLPAGLRVHPESGLVDGVAREAGVFDVELIAVGANANQTAVQAVTWFVTASDASTDLAVGAPRSSPRGADTRFRVGPSTLGLAYEADGLPPGLAIEPTAPVIAGTALELGEYEVEIRQLDQGRVVSTASFNWTIRPEITISFAL